jgi:SAM-dependent methyltransferase
VTLARTMERLFRPTAMLPSGRPMPQVAVGGQSFSTWEKEYSNTQLNLDLPPFKHVADRFRPHSIVDMGCGRGGYVRMFQDWGTADAVGVDTMPTSESHLSPGSYVLHDLTQRLDLGRMFDLVVCTDVVEYIDEIFEDTILDTINRHARELIIFSTAETSQLQTGTVNCKPLSYWLAGWQKLGWEPDVFDSLAMRTLSSLPSFRRNLVILKRIGCAPMSALPFHIADLERISNPKQVRSSQNGRIFAYPLSIPLPSLFSDKT